MGTEYRTIVELPEFIRAASTAGMTEDERQGLIDQLAADPEAGISLGGGLFKIRVARQNQGKSGGFRVIYFFRSEDLPVFLLTAFAKNQQANISPKAKAALIELCDAIADQYGSK